jgi:hypothetical protein
MDKQAAPHSATTIARNIAIGVITSVLAATVIYYLGYNKNEKADFNKRKEATIKVWNDYQENMRITGDVFDKMSKLTDDEIMSRRADANHELEVAIGNLENVKNESGADTRIYSTIDIKAQQYKDAQPVLNKLFDGMLALKVANPTEEEGQATMNKLAEEIKNQLYANKQRDSFRLATYYEALNKEYGIVLPLNKKSTTAQ